MPKPRPLNAAQASSTALYLKLLRPVPVPRTCVELRAVQLDGWDPEPLTYAPFDRDPHGRGFLKFTYTSASAWEVHSLVAAAVQVARDQAQRGPLGRPDFTLMDVDHAMMDFFTSPKVHARIRPPTGVQLRAFNDGTLETLNTELRRHHMQEKVYSFFYDKTLPQRAAVQYVLHLAIEAGTLQLAPNAPLLKRNRGRPTRLPGFFRTADPNWTPGPPRTALQRELVDHIAVRQTLLEHSPRHAPGLNYAETRLLDVISRPLQYGYTPQTNPASWPAFVLVRGQHALDAKLQKLQDALLLHTYGGHYAATERGRAFLERVYEALPHEFPADPYCDARGRLPESWLPKRVSRGPRTAPKPPPPRKNFVRPARATTPPTNRNTPYTPGEP